MTLTHTMLSAEAFWKHQFDVAETIQEDFKTPELPLARVKRVMKTDPEVAVSAELGEATNVVKCCSLMLKTMMLIATSPDPLGCTFPDDCFGSTCHSRESVPK